MVSSLLRMTRKVAKRVMMDFNIITVVITLLILLVSIIIRIMLMMVWILINVVIIVISQNGCEDRQDCCLE